MYNVQTVQPTINEESHFAELFLQSTAIREQHALRIMIESHALPIAVVNTNREIVFCNAHYAMLLGFSEWTEVAGMTVPSFFFDEQYRAHHSGMQNFIFSSLLLNTQEKQHKHSQPEIVDCAQFEVTNEKFACITIYFAECAASTKSSDSEFIQ